MLIVQTVAPPSHSSEDEDDDAVPRLVFEVSDSENDDSDDESEPLLPEAVHGNAPLVTEDFCPVTPRLLSILQGFSVVVPAVDGVSLSVDNVCFKIIIMSA